MSKHKIIQEPPKDKNNIIAYGSNEYKVSKRNYKKLLKSPIPGKSFEAETWLLFDLLQPLRASSSNLLINLSDNTKYEIDSVFEFEDVIVCIECKDGDSHDVSSHVRKIFAEKGNINSFITNTFSLKHKSIVHILTYKVKDIKDADFNRAAEKQIVIWDQRHIEFYGSIAKKLYSSGREIIFSDLLRGQKIYSSIPELNEPVIALKTRYKIPNSTVNCYHLALSPDVLKKICYVNRRGLQHSSENFDLNYQRLIKTNKLLQIQEFIKDGGSFPTSIIINLHKPLRVDSVSKAFRAKREGVEVVQVHVPKIYGSAIIIDGQHRVFGYSGLEEESKNTALSVIAFENMPELNQVQMFVEINEKQTSVDSAVMYDLYTEILPEDDFKHVVSKTIKKLNLTSSLADKIYVPSVSKKRKNAYSIYINNAGVALEKLSSLYKEVCSSNGEKFAEIIETFLKVLLNQNEIEVDINNSEESFAASNNGFFVLIKTLAKFPDFVKPYFINANGMSNVDRKKYTEEFGGTIGKAVVSIGIAKLLQEKKKSSESSKDDLAKQIIIEASKYNTKFKKIADDMFLDGVIEDLNNEFKETLLSGREDKDTDYFEEAILGTICSYINLGKEGNIWVGIDDNGKRVGIDKEYKERFLENFDKLQLHIQSEMKKIKIKGQMDTDISVEIKKYQENPLIVRITVKPDGQSVAILKIKTKMISYIKRNARKVKIEPKNVEQVFFDKTRLQNYRDLLLELYQENGQN